MNEGIVLTRDRLMEEIWGMDFTGESRTLDMHIKTLRQKLGPSGKLIQTVRNVGYSLNHISFFYFNLNYFPTFYVIIILFFSYNFRKK